MKVTLGLVLLIVALILLALASVGVPTGRINTVAAGLFCWALSTLL